MKKLIILASALLAVSAWSQVYVAPYVRSDGTYVPGHVRTAPDHNPYNNYSTQGNVNPYTGERGTVNPYAPSVPSYPQPTYRPPSSGLQPIQPIQPLGNRLF